MRRNSWLDRQVWPRLLLALLFAASIVSGSFGCVAAQKVAVPCIAHAQDAAAPADAEHMSHAGGHHATASETRKADVDSGATQDCPFCGLMCHAPVILAHQPYLLSTGDVLLLDAGNGATAKGAVVPPLPRPPNAIA